MKELLPSDIFKLLRVAGDLADGLGVSVYVVGGFVRDLLLRLPNDDVDFVVEGNGIEFAEQLCTKMKGSLTRHKEFNTAVVDLPSGLKVDVAMSRLEYYPLPVSLPVVELSSLKMDLYRRDFTVNALAVQVNSSSFGQLVDFFNSYEDIQQQTIQVLHSLSFVEDPTRIMRAIRFEQRYQWKISKQTQTLISSAMKLGLLGQLTGGRLNNELVKILKEESWIRGVRRLYDKKFRFITVFHPNLENCQNSQSFWTLLENVNQTTQLYDLLCAGKKQPVKNVKKGAKDPFAYEKWGVRFLALISTLDDRDATALFERLAISSGHQTKYFDSRRHAKSIASKLASLENSPRNSEIYFVFKDTSVEGALLACSNQFLNVKLKNYYNLYWSHIRHQKIEVNGGDLKKELKIKPGPVFSRLLKDILVAKLDGNVHNKKEEIELAKSLWEEYGNK